MNGPIHPELRRTMEMIGLVADGTVAAAKLAAQAIKSRPRTRRRRKLTAGSGTPLWNELVRELQKELAQYGTKARLARLLGVPRQRIDDYLKARRRLPDAEQTLRLMHWLSERRAGRDPS